MAQWHVRDLEDFLNRFGLPPHCGHVSGPGNLGLALGTLGFTTFLHSPNGWLHFSSYDFPVYLLFFVFALLIRQFSRMRRRVELSLAESRGRLVGQVRERTAQSSHLNRQYKTILDALPLAAALFEPGRTVRVGSALPKGWANLNRQSGPNQNARITCFPLARGKASPLAVAC